MTASQAVASTEARNLTDIATRIDDAHARVMTAFKSATLAAIEAGELLIGAKGQVAHGEWETWIDGNTSMSLRTARGYMQLARHWEGLDESKRRQVADLGVRAALTEMANPPVVAVSRHDPHITTDPPTLITADPPGKLRTERYGTLTFVGKPAAAQSTPPRTPLTILTADSASGVWLDQLEPSLRTLRKIAARTDPSEGSKRLRGGEITAADIEEITAYLASLEID